ncbi:MAG: DNA-directed RNA polymerase subunit omega [Fimbriimonadaceae bacterium]
MFPSPDVLNNFPYGRFVLANLAAKRAKMLKEGAISPVVDSESKHPLTIALIEIAREHVKPQFKSDLVAEERPELSLDDIDVAAETLIPISEPTKGVVIEHVETLLGLEELEDDHEDLESEEPIVTVATLDDLEEEVEEDVPVAEDDSGAMSLTDFEEQENIGADEEEED